MWFNLSNIGSLKTTEGITCSPSYSYSSKVRVKPKARVTFLIVSRFAGKDKPCPRLKDKPGYSFPSIEISDRSPET